MKKKTLKLHTISRLDLVQKVFCNSKSLPQTVVDDGVVKQFVGIGWVKLDREPQKGDTVIV
jgi:hypothetical protein